MFAPLRSYKGLIHCDSDCTRDLCTRHISQEKRDEAARHHLRIFKQPMSHMCREYRQGREA